MEKLVVKVMCSIFIITLFFIPLEATATFDDDEVIDLSSFEERPEVIPYSQGKMITYIRDNYSSLAKRAKVNGKVIIKFIVDKDSIPKNLKIIQERPKGMGFGEVALEAVKLLRYKYTGFDEKGKSMFIPVNFKIK